MLEILAAVDVERVARELDFQTLQDNIEQIALCNIDVEVVSGPDLVAFSMTH